MKTTAPVVEESAFTADSAPGKVDVSVGQNRKILVVDDNPVVLKAFELKLNAIGFKVICAADGTAAVSLARDLRPDLIVLDVNFPPDVGSSGLQWDAFNIIQWMRRFEESANIPFIIITSAEGAKLEEKAMAAGAVGFFHKPIHHEEFLVMVRRALSQGGTKTQAA